MNEVRRHVLAPVLVAAAVLAVHATAQEPTVPPRELSGDEVQALFERGREIREQAQDATDEPTREELQATLREIRQRRFQLFNNCEPMGLSVQFRDDESINSGIANIEGIEDRIRKMAESRLQAARLFADSTSNMLYVGMSVVGPAFSAHLFYQKPLHDAVSGLTVTSPAWIYLAGTGTHGGDVPHPVSWTHIYATRPGVVRTPRALRAACDTRASRGASTGCSVRRTRRRRRALRRGCERPGRRSLAP